MISGADPEVFHEPLARRKTALAMSFDDQDIDRDADDQSA
jgi:hypothetical protein